MKKFAYIFLAFVSINAQSSETNLACEYKGRSYTDGVQDDINVIGNAIFHMDEKKQVFYSDDGHLCNMFKAFGTFKESTLINKRNIYYQCFISNIKNVNHKSYQEILKINRISGEYSSTTEGVLENGKKFWYELKGSCSKAENKF